MEDIRNAAADRLGVEALKDKQKEATYNFVGGRDCFVLFTNGVRFVTFCSSMSSTICSSEHLAWMVWFVFRP